MAPDTDTHTPHRPMRVPQTRWDVFGELVGVRKRTAIVNEFIAWYIGEKGAKCPQPPKRPSRTAAE